MTQFDDSIFHQPTNPKLYFDMVAKAEWYRYIYYRKPDHPDMVPDYVYDELEKKIANFERKQGWLAYNSPTIRVGGEYLSVDDPECEAKLYPNGRRIPPNDPTR